MPETQLVIEDIRDAAPLAPTQTVLPENSTFLVVPSSSADDPDNNPDTDAFLATKEQVAALLNPPDIFSTDAPIVDGQVAVPGKPNQRYWRDKGSGAIDLFRFEGSAWVLKHSWGRTAVDGPANQLPIVSLQVSKNTGVVGDNFTFQASATDPDGNIVAVELFAGSRAIGRATELPYSFDYKPTVAGSYNFTAKAIDNSGAASTSAPLPVSVVPVGTVAPTVQVQVPAESIVLGATLPLYALVTKGSAPVAEVTFYDGATQLDTLTQQPYAYDWKPTASGLHALRASVLDEDGGIFFSEVVNVTVTSAPIEAPTTPAAPTFTGFTDTQAGGTVTLVPAPGIPLADYRVSLPGSTTFAAITDPAITVGNVSGTVRAYSVAATGRNQSQVATSPAFTAYTVPNNAPVVTAFAATTSTSIAAGATVGVSASATDSDGTVQSIRIYSSLSGLVATVTGATGSATTSGLVAGNHVLSAKAYDGTVEGAAFGTTVSVTATAPLPSYGNMLDADNNGGAGLDGMTISTSGPRQLLFTQKATTADPQVLTITDGGVTSFVNWSGDYKGDGAAWVDGAGVRHEFSFPNPAADFTLTY
jgi:hypothetical protein